ncbi:hypothetical protein QVD17_19040 [Tagetes erecta]|uniref:Uncharacterized protein n=1 Tax=Tagetes erecta TaxID=13708 RepID=A0AAD8KNY6_TARER|nr:hypothetical protein QVD17_19040 [Tagetes erecta]
MSFWDSNYIFSGESSASYSGEGYYSGDSYQYFGGEENYKGGADDSVNGGGDDGDNGGNEGRDISSNSPSKGQKVSVDAVDVFWRKLDFSPAYIILDEKINIQEEMEKEHEIEATEARGFKDCFLHLPAVGLGLNETEWPYVRRSLIEELDEKAEIYSFYWADLSRVQEQLNWIGFGTAPLDKWMDVPDSLIFTTNSPMPLPGGYWRNFSSPASKEWQNVYGERLQRYVNLKPNVDPEYVSLF